MAAELQPLIDKAWQYCEDKGALGRTVTLKVKFNDFEINTRSRSVPSAILNRAELERLSIALLQNEMPFRSQSGCWGCRFRRYKATRQSCSLVYRSNDRSSRIIV